MVVFLKKFGQLIVVSPQIRKSKTSRRWREIDQLLLYDKAQSEDLSHNLIMPFMIMSLALGSLNMIMLSHNKIGHKINIFKPIICIRHVCRLVCMKNKYSKGKKRRRKP